MKFLTLFLMGVSLLLGVRAESEMGLPLARPVEAPNVITPDAYADALEGLPSYVVINCKPQDHVNAYRLLWPQLNLQTVSDLVAHLRSSELVPLQQGDRVRSVGLSVGT